MRRQGASRARIMVPTSAARNRPVPAFPNSHTSEGSIIARILNRLDCAFVVFQVFEVVFFEHGIDRRVVLVSEAVEASVFWHGARGTIVPSQHEAPQVRKGEHNTSYATAIFLLFGRVGFARALRFLRTRAVRLCKFVFGWRVCPGKSSERASLV